MTWTALADFTTGRLVSASDWNKMMGASGNLAETAPAKATTAGQLFRATGAGAIEAFAVGSAGQVLTVVGGVPTWVAVPSASGIVNSQISSSAAIDQSKIAPAEHALVFNNADQAIATGTDTVLSWNSEQFDNAAFHSTVTNTPRLTIPRNGACFVFGQVTFRGNATGLRKLWLRVAGGRVREVALTPGASDCTLQVQAVWHAIAGDYFDLEVSQTSGGALNVAGDQVYSAFGVVMLAGS